jgi:hypothetical protein
MKDLETAFGLEPGRQLDFSDGEMPHTQSRDGWGEGEGDVEATLPETLNDGLTERMFGREPLLEEAGAHPDGFDESEVGDAPAAVESEVGDANPDAAVETEEGDAHADDTGDGAVDPEEVAVLDGSADDKEVHGRPNAETLASDDEVLFAERPAPDAEDDEAEDVAREAEDVAGEGPSSLEVALKVAVNNQQVASQDPEKAMNPRAVRMRFLRCQRNPTRHQVPPAALEQLRQGVDLFKVWQDCGEEWSKVEVQLNYQKKKVEKLWASKACMTREQLLEFYKIGKGEDESLVDEIIANKTALKQFIGNPDAPNSEKGRLYFCWAGSGKDNVAEGTETLDMDLSGSASHSQAEDIASIAGGAGAYTLPDTTASLMPVNMWMGTLGAATPRRWSWG